VSALFTRAKGICRENAGLSDIKSQSMKSSIIITITLLPYIPEHTSAMARAGCSVRAPIRDLLASTARQSVPSRRASASIQRVSTIPSGRSYSTHPSKPPKQGQPLAASHPHLVNSKHLTTGIPVSEYEERRKRLMDSLGEGAVVVCMGNTVRLVTQRGFFSVHFYLPLRHRLIV
jgi:hypothetical protein